MATFGDWLVDQGLRGVGLAPLLEGACERLVAEGVPLWRGYLALPTINPDIRVTNHIWRRDRGAVAEHVGHDHFPPEIENSPIGWILERDMRHHRWPLGPNDPPTGFGLVEEMRAQGATDYLAHVVDFGGRTVTALRGVGLTFATDHAGGFTEEMLATIEAVVPALALAAYRIALLDVAVGVLDAYVGLDAGRRVLAGEMRSGHGGVLEAALLFADLRDFTRTSEAAVTSRETGAAFIGTLGRHLAAMAEPVEAQGGEVLKFLGDGLIAAFPYGVAVEENVNIPDRRGRIAAPFPFADNVDPDAACAAALAAAREALDRNARLVAEGSPLGLDVALHIGTVFYGNIGAAGRLDFTVIGPAVNELARMEALCGVLGEPLLLSAAFAKRCGCATRSLGVHALRGVATSRDLFVPAP